MADDATAPEPVAAEAPRRPSTAVITNRPWREPKLKLPKKHPDLLSLMHSPRFIEACGRYGIADPASLFPPSARDAAPAEAAATSAEGDDAPGGVEAKLHVQQEKRRLVDLGGVLMERKIVVKNWKRPLKRSASAAGKLTGSGLSAAEAMEQQMNAVRLQTAAWVEGEKRRTKSELIGLVEVDTKRNVKRLLDRQLREYNQVTEVKERVEADSRRREMRKDFHEKRSGLLDRVEAAENERITRALDLRNRKVEDRERRLTEREEQRRQEALRRGQLDEEHARAVRERFEAAHMSNVNVAGEKEQKQQKALAYRLEKLYRYKKPGEVTTLAEGPGGVRLAKVQQNLEAESERKRQQLKEHADKQRERQKANTERRTSELEAKRQATAQRFERHDRRMEEVKQMDEKAKQALQERLDQVKQAVENREKHQELWIEERRQLSLARDEEKRRSVERAQRARDFVLDRLARKQEEINQRAATLKAHRDHMSHTSRAESAEIHYVTEQLKDALAVSPLESLDALRRQPTLLSKLGVEVAELEGASTSLASSMKSLSTSALSRPATSHASLPSRKAKK